jgi:hypothetical protein
MEELHSNEEPTKGMIKGILLSRSTTTSWFNWFHGEFWLFPNGILRLPLSWPKFLLLFGYFYYYTPERHREMNIDAIELAQLQQLPHALWIPRQMLDRAELKHAIGADELHLTLLSGKKIQLVWIPNTGIWRTLVQTLSDWLNTSSIVQG